MAPAPGHGPCFLEAREHSLLPGPYGVGMAIPRYPSVGGLSFPSGPSAPLLLTCTLSLGTLAKFVLWTSCRMLGLFCLGNHTQYGHLPQELKVPLFYLFFA